MQLGDPTRHTTQKHGSHDIPELPSPLPCPQPPHTHTLHTRARTLTPTRTHRNDTEAYRQEQVKRTQSATSPGISDISVNAAQIKSRKSSAPRKPPLGLFGDSSLPSKGDHIWNAVEQEFSLFLSFAEVPADSLHSKPCLCHLSRSLT